MSTKTTFKRIALVAVAALGLSMLAVTPSSAVTSGATLTIDSATDTALTGDTATAVLTMKFSAGASGDSAVVSYTCEAPAGVSSCPSIYAWQLQSSDTANVQLSATKQASPVAGSASDYDMSTGFSESTTSTTQVARSVFNVKAVNFTTVGTYIVHFNMKGTSATGTNYLSTLVSDLTWTITVTAPNTTPTSANIYVSEDQTTSNINRYNFIGATDSAVVADKGTAANPSPVAYAYAVIKNSAGDTRTATSTGTKNTSSGTAISDTLTVTVSGPGLLKGISTTAAKSATVRASNAATFSGGSYESLTVLSDGTAGVATITYSSSSGAILGSFTVTFTGTPASNTNLWFSDTIVAMGQDSPTVTGIFKDSAGSVLKSGTVYLYSSDTSVSGATPTSYPNIGRTAHACSILSTGKAVCQVAVTDTGTATFYFRDSWTVTASTWVSSGITLTVTGAVIKSLAVTFDKATYAPGERAVITYTATDSAGRALANKSLSSAFSSVTATPSFSGEVTGGQELGGTYNRASTSTTFQGLMDSGIETRVVTMPTYGGAVSYVVKYATFGSTTGELTTATANATVVDPTKDAADAATDAALEATDAAYAAQDAAQLAAEAADAATAAAEAATAAVEDLATQVASLFADLQKQITTLANVVAKIAKKVKA